MAEIIGRTDDGRNGGFIIRIGNNEIYNLIGFYYGGSDGAPTLRIGDEIKISEMYRQLLQLRHKQDEIDKIRGQLHAAAGLLRLKIPLKIAERRNKE